MLDGAECVCVCAEITEGETEREAESGAWFRS